MMNLLDQPVAYQSARINEVRQLLFENPDWHRTRLSRELCERWDWRNRTGDLKDMACRNLLLKLERRGQIVLPQRQRSSHNSCRNKQIAPVEHGTLPIDCNLCELIPLSFSPISNGADHALFNCLLDRYHYLGYGGTVGENIKYLVRDARGRVLACVLFGSAAWKCQSRDHFIGWDGIARKKNLFFLTNNSRFLVLPWVTVSCLASHILGGITHRLSSDWISKYGHSIYLIESFVERHRFKGTCYRASNWRHLGVTQGRSRNDRDRKIRVSLKDVYIYPLIKGFSRRLCHAS